MGFEHTGIVSFHPDSLERQHFSMNWSQKEPLQWEARFAPRLEVPRVKMNPSPISLIDVTQPQMPSSNSTSYDTTHSSDIVHCELEAQEHIPPEFNKEMHMADFP
jgi:hypothetical protein